MVNDDLRLWVMRFSLRSQPPVVPPPPDTVFELPLVPAFGRTSAFYRGGEEYLEFVEEAFRGNRAGGEGSYKRKAAVGPSSPDASPTRKNSIRSCNMYAATGKCKWCDRIYMHGSPPADSPSPATLSIGGGGILAAVAGAGSHALVLRAGNAPRAVGGGRTTGGGGFCSA